MEVVCCQNALKYLKKVILLIPICIFVNFISAVLIHLCLSFVISENKNDPKGECSQPIIYKLFYPFFINACI